MDFLETDQDFGHPFPCCLDQSPKSLHCLKEKFCFAMERCPPENGLLNRVFLSESGLYFLAVAFMMILPFAYEKERGRICLSDLASYSMFAIFFLGVILPEKLCN